MAEPGKLYRSGWNRSRHAPRRSRSDGFRRCGGGAPDAGRVAGAASRRVRLAKKGPRDFSRGPLFESAIRLLVVAIAALIDVVLTTAGIAIIVTVLLERGVSRAARCADQRAVTRRDAWQDRACKRAATGADSRALQHLAGALRGDRRGEADRQGDRTGDESKTLHCDVLP